MRSWALTCLFVSSLACSVAPVGPPPLETLVRTVGTGPGPLVVMLHGYGSQPETFLGLADRSDLPAGTTLVLPRAPLAIPGFDRGTMWWPLPDDLSRIAREPTPGLEAARVRVAALLDGLAREHPDRPIVLGGFSQGAITTLEVALHDPERALAGIVLMSGAPSDETRALTRLSPRRGLRVYVSHGTQDDVLRYDDDAHLVEAMRAHGLDVSFTSFEGGHVVTDQVSNDLAAFVTRCASR